MTVRRQLTIFYAVAAATFVMLSVGAVFACRIVAQKEAFEDAEQTTARIANFVVSPLLPDALTPGSAARKDLDRLIAGRIQDGYLAEAMVWDRNGRIVWSSSPRNIGMVLDPPDEAIAAISRRTVSSGFEEQPEAVDPDRAPNDKGYVEVYVPFPEGKQSQLAFEAYYDYGRVSQTAGALTRQLLPLVLVPLVLMQVIQVPIAGSLARRVRRHEAERRRLLERHLAVSERERIRIAADLHDGPIQDLAGVGYALGAIAPTVPTSQDRLMGTVQDTIYRATESLRRMMVDLYPPDLQAGQLHRTIDDLAEPLRERGIAVDVVAEPLPELDGESVAAVYRVAREALANVLEHAHAARVTVMLSIAAIGNGPDVAVRLAIMDDGIGVDPARLDRRADGHLGLRLLTARVADLGGSLTVSSGPDSGTVVAAVLPIAPSESATVPTTGNPSGSIENSAASEANVST